MQFECWSDSSSFSAPLPLFSKSSVPNLRVGPPRRGTRWKRASWNYSKEIAIGKKMTLLFLTFLKIFSQVFFIYLFIFFLWNTAEFRLFSSFKIKQSERRTPSHRSQLNRRHLWCGSRHYLAMVWSESNREPMQRHSYISRANTVVLLWLNQLTLLVSQPHFCLCGHDMMCPVKIKVDKCYRKCSISSNFSGQRSATV